MIRSFRDDETEKVFGGEFSKKFQAIARSAQHRLTILNAAKALLDLTAFPGNHLEALKGDRKGQRSIRINDQLRICFVWDVPDASDVEIVDYR